MVAEPKPHQTGRKRQNVAKTGNDWDYYYDSYYASTSFPVGPSRLVPPIKRQRLMTTARNGKNNQSQKTSTVPPLDQLKVYSKFTRLIINRKDFFRRNVPSCEHSCRGDDPARRCWSPRKTKVQSGGSAEVRVEWGTPQDHIFSFPPDRKWLFGCGYGTPRRVYYIFLLIVLIKGGTKRKYFAWRCLRQWRAVRICHS
jgi:hypothetical protein